MPNRRCGARVAACLLPSLFAAATAAESVNGWTLESDPSLEAALETMDAAIRDDEYQRINSVVIIRDGKLVYERYYNGSDRNTTHNPRSVGKTFVTPILGLFRSNILKMSSSIFSH